MSRISLSQSEAMQSVALPADLRKELAQLDWRLRWVNLVKGCGSLLFVGLILAALFLVIDFLVPLSGMIRFVFLATLTATIGWLLYHWLFVPLSRKRRWAELAFLIDRSFPALQERVSSTVELSMLTEQQQHISSEFMMNRLRHETDKRLSRVDLWECLSLNSMAYALVAAIVTSVVLSAPLFLNSGGYSLLWQRLLTPWANLDSASNLTFEVEQGDRTVPRGDDVFILARPVWRYREGKIPREINLTWTDERGKTESREMSYDVRKKGYVGKIPQVLSPLTYVLYGSGARSRTFSIHVADRPRLVDVRLIIQPPAYTGMEPTLNEGAMGTIRAVQGARLFAEITFEHPVEKVEWRWNTLRDQIANEQGGDETGGSETDPEQTTSEQKFPKTHLQGVLSDDGLSARIEATADMSDSFIFKADSADGLENINEPERMIQIIPDRAPRIDISGDRDPVQVRPDDIIPIDLSADDDFGVQEVQVIVEHLSAGLESPEILTWSSKKTGETAKEVYDHLDLDLSQFELKGGDILGYRAVARDGRPIPEPNETWTSRRVVMISKDVAPLAGQIVEEYYEQMRRQVDAVKSEMTKLRRDVEEKRRELDPKPRDLARETVKEKRPDWLKDELSLSLKLEELSRKLRQRPITEQLSKQNAVPAQKLLDEAAQELEDFKLDKQSNPVEMVRNHEKSLRDAESLLTRLRNQLDDAERIEQELVKVQQLARRARNLAKDAAQINQDQQNPQAAKQSATKKDNTEKNDTKQNDSASQESPEKSASEKSETASAEQPSQQPEQSETASLEKLQQEHASLSQDLEDLFKRRPELMQAAKNALLSDLAEISKKADQLAKQQNSLTESTEQFRQDTLQQQQELALELKQTEKIAEELAAKSEQESSKTASPVFDAAPAREAVKEQKQANLSDAMQAVQEAKEALKRFSQAQQNAENLPQDSQQASRQLAQKAEQLAKKVDEHQQRHQKLLQEKKQNQQEQKKRELLPAKERAEAPALKDLSKQIENDQAEQQKLAEELAGLMQAVAGLQIPPGVKSRQYEAERHLDQAADELSKQSTQSDDRLRDAANSLKKLADQLGTQKKRADKTEPQVESLKKEAEKLAGQIQETTQKGAQADPEAVKNLAKKQLDLAKRLMHTDSVDQEKKLAEAAQAAVKAHDQLKAGKLKQAEASEKEFAEKLEKLKQAIQEAAKKTESDNVQPAADQAETAQAWEKAKLPEELEKIRFPQQPGSPEELQKSLAEIAKAQKELQEKTEKAITENSKHEQASAQKRALQQLNGQQRKLAEQTERLQGKTAALPRMKAAQALREASEALKEGDAEESQTLQKEAASQLELAQEIVKKEVENSTEKIAAEKIAAKTNKQQPSKENANEPSAPQLAKALEEKLKQLDQNLAEALKATAETAPQNGTNNEEQNGKPSSEQKLADALENLKQSQQRIAEQASQLAQQSKLEQPDRQELIDEMEQAAQAAKQASEKLQDGQLNQANQQAEQSAKHLQQAQQQDNANKQAQAATEQLAEQQKQLAEQMAKLAKNPQNSRLAREQTQKDLNREAERLTKKLQEIAESSQADPIHDKQTGKKTEGLTDQSEQANQQMEQALSQSRKGNLQQSAQQSKNAAEQLESLADQSAQIAQMKRDTLVPEPVGEEASEASRMLEQAEESLKQAMQQADQAENSPPAEPSDSSAASKSGEASSQKPPPSSKENQSQSPSKQNQQADSKQQSSPAGQESGQSPSSMQKLAEQLSQAAQALEQAHQNLQPSQKESSSKSKQQKQKQKSGKGKPSEQAADSETGNSSELTGDGEMTGKILRSALMRDWGQKQGTLDAELTDGRRRHIDQEYAPLIRRYFEALAQPEPQRKNPESKK